MNRQLCVATRNTHKLQEIRAVLADLALEITSPAEHPGCNEVEEDAPTLEGNAEKKARHVAACTGLPSLADDTGLEVDALNGAPGVYSARYAGPQCSFADNNRKLLHELQVHQLELEMQGEELSAARAETGSPSRSHSHGSPRRGRIEQRPASAFSQNASGVDASGSTHPMPTIAMGSAETAGSDCTMFAGHRRARLTASQEAPFTDRAPTRDVTRTRPRPWGDRPRGAT